MGNTLEGRGGHAAPPPPIRLPLANLPRPVARMAAALLDDAAAQGGGARRSAPDAEELDGCAPGPARRAAAALAELLAAAPQAPPGLAPPEGASAREAWTRALPLGEAARLTVFVRGDGVPVLQRLAPARTAEPGARDALCRRLLAALASPRDLAELPRLRPGLRLALDLPAEGLPRGSAGGAGGGGPVALLPAAAAARPALLAAGLARLRAAGWSPALRLPGPAAAALLDLARLPDGFDLCVLEDPGDALPEGLPPLPLALAGRVGPGLRARAAAEGWPVERPA